MSKAIVKSVGDFSHYINADYVPAFRPAVVTKCSRLSELVGEGKIELLGDVDAPANDNDFLKFYVDHDKDEEAAVENYTLHVQGVVEEAEKAEDQELDDAEAEAKAKAEAEAKAKAKPQPKATKAKAAPKK